MDESLRLVLEYYQREAGRAKLLVEDMRANRKPRRDRRAVAETGKLPIELGVDKESVLREFAPKYADSIQSIHDELKNRMDGLRQAKTPQAVSLMADLVDDGRRQLEHLIEEIRDENS